MTTARDLVYDAMSIIGSLGQGDVAPSDSDAQLVLRAFQRMTDSWANDGLMVYALTQETITLTANDSTYTTANLSTATRPAAIESGFIRYSNIDYPLELVSVREFDRLSYKPTTGRPEVVLYKPAMTAGTFEFYPTPDAAYVAYFNVRRVLLGTIVLGTTISLPPGYEEAIVQNLAVAAAPLFGMEAKPSTQQAARNSKAILRRQNYVPLILQTPFERTERSDIFTG